MPLKIRVFPVGLGVFRLIAACIVAFAASIGPSIAGSNPGWSVPILLYHRFDATSSALTAIAPSVFGDQLKYMKEHDISVLPLRSLVDGMRHKQIPAHLPAVVLTADDGHRSVYTEMFPLLRRYGVHATVFVYPSAISNAQWALSWEQLDEMVKSGLVDVQSHTYWHPNFDIEKRRLSPQNYRDFAAKQLILSKTRIEARLGTTVDLLAWPFGLRNSELDDYAAEAGYIAAFTIERNAVHAGGEPYALPRFLITNYDRGPRFAALISVPEAEKVRP